MIPKLPEPIDTAEMDELRALYAKLPALSKIHFSEVLVTPHLLTPLRRTLQAQKLAAKNFQLTPPPAPTVIGKAPRDTSSSGQAAQRAVAVSPRRAHAWDERR